MGFLLYCIYVDFYRILAAIIIFLILIYALFLEPLEISKGKKINN